MWEHRNSVYHSPTHPWRLTTQSAQANSITAIWTAYSLEDYLPSDCHLFLTSSDHIIQHYHEKQQKQWLASIEAAQERLTSVTNYPPVGTGLETQHTSFCQ